MAVLLDPLQLQNLVFSIEGPIQELIKVRQAILGDSSKPICKFYLKGTCMKAEQCPFRHAKTEKTVVCKHWLRGLCKKGDLCEFLHEYDLSRMPSCHFFATYGQCSNDDCPFLHVRPEDRVKDCPWYERGFCKHGPNCKNRHMRKVACPDYLAGFCILGPACPKGHPKFEVLDEAGQKKVPLFCTQCNNVGHTASVCPEKLAPIITSSQARAKAGLRPLESVTCFKCSEVGHYANVCPNKRRAPPPGGYNIPVPARIGGFDSKPIPSPVPMF